ncbi:hypothetical protein GCM10022251_02450 [Phytohabitans flavus]
MQPCAVCGGVQVDAAGYCTQCGTFRGVPHQPPPPPSYPQAPPPAYPGYPQPGSPPAYPTSVPPGYPTSVPPAYPQQISGAGYPGSQQTSGGGYPGFPPPPPQRRRSYLVPLAALGSTLVVLVVAIVLVVALRGGGGEDPIAGPTTGAPTSAGPAESASAAPAGDVDQCVIGTWRVTSHKEDVDFEDLGKVTFTGGENATLKLNADGTGETDYGSGTEFEGEAKGRTYRLEVSGKLTFEYTAKGGTAKFTDVDSKASGKLFIDGEQYGDSVPFNAEADSSTYTCSTDLLTQKTFLYTTEYERAS